MTHVLKPNPALATIGWKEWGSLLTLGIKRIRLKIDTGAKTSALHAVDLDYFERDGRMFVSFYAFSYPSSKNKNRSMTKNLQTQTENDPNQPREKKNNRRRIQAEVVRFTIVKSSNGSKMRRPVIASVIEIGSFSFPIELSLVDRSAMGHKILIGRAALTGRFLVDVQNKYLLSRL